MNLLTNLWAIPFPNIDPVALQIGPVAIKWYGLAYLAGLLLGWLYIRRLLSEPHLWADNKPPFRQAQVDDLLLYITAGVVLGGRLGFVIFYEPSYYLANPQDIIAVWKGGMAFHGALVGCIIAIWAFARRNGVNPWSTGDLVTAAVPIGLFFGRIANFINGELFGRPTTLPWGMVFPEAALHHPDVEPTPRHPSQLYEAALEGLRAVPRPAAADALLRRLEAPWSRQRRLPRRLRTGALDVGAVPRAALRARLQRRAADGGHRLLHPDAAARPVRRLSGAHARAEMIRDAPHTATPLARRLAERIAQEGPISVADYMQTCLQDPEHGYYRRRMAVGSAGDFVTAPEISQVFGELIGLWCAVVWQQMGAPQGVRLIELGPGRGTLMRDALRAVRLVPEFRARAEGRARREQCSARKTCSARRSTTRTSHCAGSASLQPGAAPAIVDRQ